MRENTHYRHKDTKEGYKMGAVAQLTDQVSYSDSSFLLHKNMKTLASSTPARVLVV